MGNQSARVCTFLYSLHLQHVQSLAPVDLIMSCIARKEILLMHATTKVDALQGLSRLSEGPLHTLDHADFACMKLNSHSIVKECCTWLGIQVEHCKPLQAARWSGTYRLQAST